MHHRLAHRVSGGGVPLLDGPGARSEGEHRVPGARGNATPDPAVHKSQTLGLDVTGGQDGGRRPAGFPIEDARYAVPTYRQHGSPLVDEAYFPVAAERVERADGLCRGDVPEPEARAVTGPTAHIADRQRFAVAADGQLLRHAGLGKDTSRLAARRIEEHGLPNAADDQGPAVGSECQAQDKGGHPQGGQGRRPVAVS